MPLALAEYAIDLACSSVRTSASTEPMSGFGRAGAHGHADSGSREIDARAGDDLALLDEFLQRLRREDHHVGRLAAAPAGRGSNPARRRSTRRTR